MKTLNSKKSSIAKVLALLILSSQSVFAQYFFKSYDVTPFTTQMNYGRSIERLVTYSKGWSIAGFSGHRGAGIGYDWLFLRADTMGNFTSGSLLGFSSNDYCYSHVQLTDTRKSYVLAGQFNVLTGGIWREKASIVLLDSTGNLRTSRQITHALDNRHSYNQVVRNTSNIFTLAGYIGYDGSNKVLVTQYYSSGTMLWGKRFSTFDPAIHEGISICYQSWDGTYGITGRTDYFTNTPGKYDVFVTRLSSAGAELWTKVYRPQTGIFDSYSSRIIPMPDSGFVVAGRTNVNDSLRSDIWVFRINSRGSIVWSSTYGVSNVYEAGCSIITIKTDASALFLTGMVNNDRVVLAKINKADGALVWSKYHSVAQGVGYDLEENPKVPYGFAVTGYIDTAAGVYRDPFLMRTDIDGEVSAGCLESIALETRTLNVTVDSMGFISDDVTDAAIQPNITAMTPTVREICDEGGAVAGKNAVTEPVSFLLEQNYPNPFNPATVIRFRIPVSGFVSLRVYDMLGKEVSALLIGDQPAGSYEVSFNGTDKSSGIYFYKLIVRQAGSSTDAFADVKKMMFVK